MFWIEFENKFFYKLGALWLRILLTSVNPESSVIIFDSPDEYMIENLLHYVILS